MHPVRSHACELPRPVDMVIKDIAGDHESGARQLALKALSALKLSVNEFPLERTSWCEIVNSAKHISEARPSMRSTIYTTILRALNEIKDIYPSPETTEILDRLIVEEQTLLDRLAEHFTKYIISSFPETVSILTLSNSSTIATALKALFKSPQCPSITLTILESRPLLEGLNLAKCLLPHKPDHVSIQIATDAAGAYFASSSDLTLIGSDHINPYNGDVKNKIGSVAVAKSARRTLTIASTDKLGDVEVDQQIEENDEAEVRVLWNVNVPENVKVRNVYFEWVNGEDVHDYVTERGILAKFELREIYDQRLKWEEVWTDLDF
jgi:translation initiation factor 2B subunit (eIF-2B alpha/beta/delta family)